jgi:FkbM family methyltransferase
MKILLDVGAHYGESALAALDERYSFDKIVCFEPSAECWERFEKLNSKKVELCKFGLWNQTTEKNLYGGGELGGTIFKDMTTLDNVETKETISLVRATDWFKRNVTSSDIVFMKLNCEGAECDIIEDLMESDELKKVYSAIISFDVRLSPSLRHRESQIRRKIKSQRYYNMAYSDNAMIGPTHEARIQNWLDAVGAYENLSLSELRKKYDLKLKSLSSKSDVIDRIEDFFRFNLVHRFPVRVQVALKQSWRAIRKSRELRAPSKPL